METFDATDQCCSCLKRNLSRITAPIKIINSASEVEAVCEQLNVDNVDIGFKLCDKCRRRVFLAHEKLHQK